MFDQQELENLLKLSRLSAPQEQLSQLSSRLRKILRYFELLSRFDTTSVDVDVGETVSVSERRADAAVPGLRRDEITAFSETFDDGFFLVPRILGDDNGRSNS